MRLSRIEIENFKAIGKRQSIDLKPITLLFGPNSAGKSTILQALHFVREILERQNPDPDQTIAGGPIDLGGFKALVHNHKLDRAIKIKLVIDIVDEEGSDYLPLNSGASIDDAMLANLGIRYVVGQNADLLDYAIVREVAVGIEVSWSDLLAGPYVSSLAIQMDGIRIAAITSPPQAGRAILTNFELAHPLLQPIVDVDEILAHEEADDLEPDAAAGYVGDNPFESPLCDEIWALSRDMSNVTTDLDVYDFRIAVETLVGALPDPDKKLLLEMRDPEVTEYELEQSTPRVKGLTALLDELILGPVRIVREMLRSTTYIGPLRDIPARGFRPRSSPDESRWAQGLAAWDLLYTDVKGDLTDAVNNWLSSADKLRTGYRVEKIAVRQIPIPSRMSSLFDRGLIEDDLGELQELYENLETRVEVALRDFEQGILVAPSDVGVGISQMVPIIVGCLADGIGLLIVEQPELHVHPAVQVGIGDLLIHAVSSDNRSVTNSKSLLVETHSEHIMLRLLRRIRETAEGDLPPLAPSLTPDPLSIVYVEPADDGVKFRPLRIDEEGEFIDRWPSGFFEERSEELF